MPNGQTKDIAGSHHAGKAQEKSKRPEAALRNLNSLNCEPFPSEYLANDVMTEAPLEKHAALLSDARLSHPANAEMRAHITTGLQQNHGNVYVQRLLASRGIQAKLTATPPDDRYEQEADRAANAIIAQATTPEIQRQAEEEEEIQTKMADSNRPQAIQLQEIPEEEETVPARKSDYGPIQMLQHQAEEEVQTKPLGGSPSGEIPDALEAQIQAAKTSGQPLPDSLRTSLEPHFGRDFGGVRIHTGGEADDLSRQLGARAFTTGHDIFFREGEYQPQSDDGKGLIAHEITHVVQQNALGPSGRADRGQLLRLQASPVEAPGTTAEEKTNSPATEESWLYGVFKEVASAEEVRAVVAFMVDAGVRTSKITYLVRQLLKTLSPSQVFAVLSELRKVPPENFEALFKALASPSAAKLFKIIETAGLIIAIIIMAIDVAAAIDKEEYGAAAAVVYTFFMGLGIPWAGFLNALQAAIAAIAPQYATHRFWSVLRAVDPIALGSIVPDMCVTAVQSLFSNHKEELAEELVARMRKAGAGIFVRFGEWLAEEMYDLAYPEEREGGTAPARVPEFRALKSYEYRH